MGDGLERLNLGPTSGHPPRPMFLPPLVADFGELAQHIPQLPGGWRLVQGLENRSSGASH